MTFKHIVIYTAILASIAGSALAQPQEQKQAKVGENTEVLDTIDVNAQELQQIGYHAVGTSSVSQVNVPIIDTTTTVTVVTTKLIE